jgi:hypothetical protein
MSFFVMYPMVTHRSIIVKLVFGPKDEVISVIPVLPYRKATITGH